MFQSTHTLAVRLAATEQTIRAFHRTRFPPRGTSGPSILRLFIISMNAQYATGRNIIAMTPAWITSHIFAPLKNTEAIALTAISAEPATCHFGAPRLPRISEKHSPQMSMFMSTAFMAMPTTPKPNTYLATSSPTRGARVSERLEASRLTSMAAMSRSGRGRALRAASLLAASSAANFCAPMSKDMRLSSSAIYPGTRFSAGFSPLDTRAPPTTAESANPFAGVAWNCDAEATTMQEVARRNGMKSPVAKSNMASSLKSLFQPFLSME